MKIKKTLLFSLGIVILVVLILVVLFYVYETNYKSKTLISQENRELEIEHIDNEKINEYLNQTNSSVYCIGQSEKPVTFFAGETNNIMCSVRAQNPQSKYNFRIRFDESQSTLQREEVSRWFIGGMSNEIERMFNPSSQEMQKLWAINIPANAPVGRMGFTIEVDPKDPNDSVSSWSGVLTFNVRTYN
jgi:uncharacterized protein YxeA